MEKLGEKKFRKSTNKYKAKRRMNEADGMIW